MCPWHNEKWKVTAAPADHNSRYSRTRTALSEHPVMAMTTAFGRRASAAASVGLADGVGTGGRLMRIPPRPSALPGASEHFYAGNEIITLSSVSHPVRESCRRSASPPRMEEGRAGSLPSFLYGSIEVHLPPIKSGRKEEERSKQHLHKLHPYALTITHMGVTCWQRKTHSNRVAPAHWTSLIILRYAGV